MSAPHALHSTDEAGLQWRIVTVSILTITGAILPRFPSGALEVQLAESLGIAEAGIGPVVGAFFGMSALVSPRLGRIVERFGLGPGDADCVGRGGADAATDATRRGIRIDTCRRDRRRWGCTGDCSPRRGSGPRPLYRRRMPWFGLPLQARRNPSCDCRRGPRSSIHRDPVRMAMGLRVGRHTRGGSRVAGSAFTRYLRGGARGGRENGHACHPQLAVVTSLDRGSRCGPRYLRHRRAGDVPRSVRRRGRLCGILCWNVTRCRERTWHSDAVDRRMDDR